ncbi:MAG: PSD1 domain-containing protein [Verrucomicrobiales bacterium]|nr:PSD1 domain-containing protein [Verrucomicrobiales bacterium]
MPRRPVPAPIAIAIAIARAALASVMRLGPLSAALTLAASAATVSAPKGTSAAATASARSESTEPLRFNRDIRPILSDNCFACHGFDSKTRKAGLRLDIPDGAFAPAKSGKPAIRPGKPDESELWVRIQTTDPDDLMPPGDSHKVLTTAQKERLRRWIEEGAAYQKHWAFESPVAQAPPVPRSGPAPAHPVDRFVAHRLESEGLTLSPEASRETLVRRLAFDLTGLPPSPEETRAFLADTAPGAYERLVDRFLASPRYGEHMARHWLDVARYADTHGLHLDNERQMWAWRDWVVDSFNQNQPFDAFTVEQLAGDLLPQPTQAQLVATGFNRNNVTTSEGGSIDAEFIFRYAVDRTATTVQAWMGLTAGCAVCHDHKFDPISMKEFYSLYAFFHSAADPAMDGNIPTTPPTLKLETPEDKARLAELEQAIARAEARIPEALARVVYADPASQSPTPPARTLSQVWADDDVPSGWRVSASPGAGTQTVTAENGKVASGKRAWKRQDRGLAQDVFEGGPALEIPSGAKLFASVYLDPSDPPKTIMLQYRTGDWKHRAVWGDYDAIDWGARGTTERVHQGPLPPTGRWVRLEFDADGVGLEPGAKVQGFALTQYGGTVFWDVVGVSGRVDPATDPRHSFLAWLKSYQGKPAKDLPQELRSLLGDSTVDARTPEQESRLREHFLARVCADTRSVFDPILGEVAAAKRRRDAYRDGIPSTFVWRDLDQPRESHVMQRGAYDRPGDRVFPGVPAALPPLPNTNNPTRLDFARWLVSDDHPLTARVTVNRFWQQFFGTGLVKSSGDFGSQGEPPSHPELLDWLAVRFRSTGWDVKSFVRLLVTSRTYRQSSHVSPELLRRDPENRLLARAPRFRLDAEQIRDNALCVGGLLVQEMGGKGVKPYQPPNIWEPVGFVGSNTREYRQDTGSALYRRSLYTFFKRTAPPPFMAAFDAPNREQICTRRERSNTPLQALQLMNDIQHFEAARGLAERMLLEGGPTPDDRLAFAYRLVLSRTPDPDEIVVLRAALSDHLARYAADPAAARAVVTYGESRPSARLPAPELAAYTLAANLLLNLDETLTRN